MRIDLTPSARRVADLVAGVADDQLGLPTPCPHYTVGDLVDHVGGLALAFTAAARKELGGDTTQAPSGDARRLGRDWRARIPPDVEALAEAWQDPEAWTGMTQAGGVELPGEVGGLVALNELVVHGWDLSRGTGQAYAPDEASIEAAQGLVAQFASPDADAGPDVPFGPPVEVDSSASAIDRLVALAGRNPGWAAD